MTELLGFTAAGVLTALLTAVLSKNTNGPAVSGTELAPE